MRVTIPTSIPAPSSSTVLAAALERFLAGKSAPLYLRVAATAWLTKEAGAKRTA